MKKIVKQKKYEINPFKEISIGDPSYFEDLEKDFENNTHLLSLTCSLKLKKYKSGYVQITQYDCHDEEYNMDYSVITVNFALADDEALLQVYAQDKWFGKKTLDTSYELGCDTASYEIIVDGRYDEVKTGADGYYGDVKLLKGEYGLIGNLDFDADLFTFDEVVEHAAYWFNVKELRDKKTSK